MVAEIIDNRYKPIPEGAIALKLEIDWCDDEVCNCNHAEIKAVYPCNHPSTPPWLKGKQNWTSVLWDSDWLSADEHFCLQLIRNQVTSACKHYQMDIDVSSDCIWDWRGECVV